jgi:hypothetical protein
LSRSEIRIDATVLEKRKAEPHLRSELALYKMGWFLHFKHVAPLVATSEDRLLVVAASLGTKKTRRFFSDAVDDVVRQVSPARHRVAFWAADSDPCIHQQGHLGAGGDLLLLRTTTAPRQLSAETEDPRGSFRHKETAVVLWNVAGPPDVVKARSERMFPAFSAL